MENINLLEENKQLKERIKFLEELLNKSNSKSKNAYNAIRAMIFEKVENEVELDNIDGNIKDWTRKRVERKIMQDLKWEMRIRRTEEFRADHIEPAQEYINNYILSEEMKKSIWR